MPTPNWKRHRINVDLGSDGRHDLDRLCKSIELAKITGTMMSQSEMIRWLIKEATGRFCKRQETEQERKEKDILLAFIERTVKRIE